MFSILGIEKQFFPNAEHLSNTIFTEFAIHLAILRRYVYLTLPYAPMIAPPPSNNKEEKS